MLVWLVDYLVFEEEVARLRGSNAGTLDALVDGEEGEQVFFEYTARAYGDFLEGSDNYTALDEDLADTFQQKNTAVEAEIYRLEKSNGAL